MLRRTVRYLLIASLLAAPGCEIITPDAESACAECRDDLQIHLRNSFENDRVRVKLDDNVVYNGRVTTDDVWSLAEIVELRPRPGRHVLDVMINGSYKASETIDLDRPTYVHVHFNPETIPALGIQEGIVVNISDQRPMYD